MFSDIDLFQIQLLCDRVIGLWKCICVCACEYVHMYVCIYVCMYVRMCVCIYVRALGSADTLLQDPA